MADDSVVLGQLAEEFSNRVRQGQMPSIEEYAARHPTLADRIRALFPTLMLLEGLAAGGAATGEKPGGEALQTGERFGAYRIERELGRGGMGIVYEAVHLALERRVALKVLPLHGTSRADHLERFLREARTAAGLHHTNIVPVFDVGQVNGIPYYAMQLIRGQGLDRVRRPLPAGALEQTQTLPPNGTEPPLPSSPVDLPPLPEVADPYRFVAEVGIQAAEALAYAHARGVIHRDIKPSNLLLDGQGVVWITDFGLARRLDDVALTHSGQILGTPRYMSPEQALAAKEPVDHRTDIYSLGATLYELLTRRPAFDGPTPHDVVLQILQREPVAPRKLDPRVPRDLETIVLKAMAKHPGERYQSAQELADDLRRFAGNEPIRARRISLPGRLVRWSKRNPVVAGLLAAVALLLLGGAAISSFFAVAASREARRAEQQFHKATKAQKDALDRASENRRLAVEQMVRQGVRMQEQGDFSAALLWFTEALKHEEDDQAQAELHRLRLQTLAPFCPRPEHIWFHPAAAYFQGFCATGKRVVTICTDESVRVWDVESGKLTCPPLSLEKSSWVAISDAGRRVMTVSNPGLGKEEKSPQTVQVWDADSGKLLCRQSSSREGLREGSLVISRTNQPKLSQDGQRLLTRVDAGKVQVWSVETGQPLGPSLEHKQTLLGMAFLGSDRVLTLTCPAAGKQPADPASRTLKGQVWQVPAGKLVFTLEPSKDCRSLVYRLSPDGRFLLGGEWYGEDAGRAANAQRESGISLWDLSTGKVRGRNPLPGAFTTSDSAPTVSGLGSVGPAATTLSSAPATRVSS